jgi:hypothetical protein
LCDELFATVAGTVASSWTFVLDEVNEAVDATRSGITAAFDDVKGTRSAVQDAGANAPRFQTSD